MPPVALIVTLGRDSVEYFGGIAWKLYAWIDECLYCQLAGKPASEEGLQPEEKDLFWWFADYYLEWLVALKSLFCFGDKKDVEELRERISRFADPDEDMQILNLIMLSDHLFLSGRREPNNDAIEVQVKVFHDYKKLQKAHLPGRSEVYKICYLLNRRIVQINEALKLRNTIRALPEAIQRIGSPVKIDESRWGDYSRG